MLFFMGVAFKEIKKERGSGTPDLTGRDGEGAGQGSLHDRIRVGGERRFEEVPVAGLPERVFQLRDREEPGGLRGLRRSGNGNPLQPDSDRSI